MARGRAAAWRGSPAAAGANPWRRRRWIAAAVVVLVAAGGILATSGLLGSTRGRPSVVLPISRQPLAPVPVTPDDSAMTGVSSAGLVLGFPLSRRTVMSASTPLGPQQTARAILLGGGSPLLHVPALGA